MMFHCLSVPPGNRTCWRQRWNKPGRSNLAALKNQPSQAPKSKNQHFCLEFTGYPSQNGHANRPCNPQRDPCLEQQCLTRACSWVTPFSSSEHLCSLESCWAESVLLSGAVPLTESPGLTCCVPPRPLLQILWQETWEAVQAFTEDVRAERTESLLKAHMGANWFWCPREGTPKDLLPWKGAK